MKITIKNLQNKLSIRPVKIKSLVQKIARGERAGKRGWINICFVDNSLIKKFNAKFLKINRPTDVLAFDLSGKKGLILADILISADKAIEQARNFKTTPDDELLLYVAHGILHILGFDDRTDSQRKVMRKKESEYVDR